MRNALYVEGSKHKRHAYGDLILRFRSYDKNQELHRRSFACEALRERKRRSITGLGIIYRLAHERGAARWPRIASRSDATEFHIAPTIARVTFVGNDLVADIRVMPECKLIAGYHKF